jgi:hypothetical protein
VRKRLVNVCSFVMLISLCFFLGLYLKMSMPVAFLTGILLGYLFGRFAAWATRD